MILKLGQKARKSIGSFEDTNDQKWEKEIRLYIALSRIVSNKSL